ncbi:Uncharacterised protein [Mycobacterium tuberculosis]|nr:Uncharacterised protein [Mycobacterium tuberculosis]
MPAITVGLIQLNEVLILNLPTKGIVLGDATQGSTLNDDLVSRNFQHHTDNGTLWNEYLASIHYPLITRSLCQFLMETRCIKCINCCDLILQTLLNLASSIDSEISSLGMPSQNNLLLRMMGKKVL